MPEPLRRGADRLDRLGERQGAEPLDPVVEVAASEVFHDDIITSPLHPSVEDLDDVGVQQPLGRRGLAEEPMQQGRVLRQAPGQDLHGDLVAALDVGGAIDRPHPAGTQGVKQSIAADLGRGGLGFRLVHGSFPEDRPSRIIGRDRRTADSGRPGTPGRGLPPAPPFNYTTANAPGSPAAPLTGRPPPPEDRKKQPSARSSGG